MNLATGQSPVRYARGSTSELTSQWVGRGRGPSSPGEESLSRAESWGSLRRVPRPPCLHCSLPPSNLSSRLDDGDGGGWKGLEVTGVNPVDAPPLIGVAGLSNQLSGRLRHCHSVDPVKEPVPFIKEDTHDPHLKLHP